MPKFRKKPVVIEAERVPALFEIDARLALEEWFGRDREKVSWQGPGVVIKTLEGNMIGNAGDWIIRGVKGELYPCKPDIFEATYEEVL